MIRIEFSDQIGGVSVYCGSKETPKGRVKGTANQCYKNGIRNGFVAGIQQAQKEETKKRQKVQSIVKELNERNLNKAGYLTRQQFNEEFDNGEAILQRPLQTIARVLGIDNPTQKKSLLLPRIQAHNWTKIKLKDLIK
jgi:hypothetical protein